MIEFLNRTGSRHDKAVETLIANDAEIGVAEITLSSASVANGITARFGRLS